MLENINSCVRYCNIMGVAQIDSTNGLFIELNWVPFKIDRPVLAFFFWHVRSRQQLQTSSLSMDFWTVIFILVFCDLFLIATKLRNRFLVDVIIVSAGNFKWHFKKRMFWNLDREYSWFDFPSIWEKKHTFKYHQCQYRHRLPPR